MTLKGILNYIWNYDNTDSKCVIVVKDAISGEYVAEFLSDDKDNVERYSDAKFIFISAPDEFDKNMIINCVC